MTSRFLVVRTPDHLVRACADVSALAAAWRRQGDDDTAPLLGIWLEQPGDAGVAWPLEIPRACSTGHRPLILESCELAGVWALCRTPAVSRTQLVDALSAATRRSGARFLPVFADDSGNWRREWRVLAARHPGLILPPIALDTEGRLKLDDLEWAEAAADDATGESHCRSGVDRTHDA